MGVRLLFALALMITNACKNQAYENIADQRKQYSSQDNGRISIRFVAKSEDGLAAVLHFLKPAIRIQIGEPESVEATVTSMDTITPDQKLAFDINIEPSHYQRYVHFSNCFCDSVVSISPGKSENLKMSVLVDSNIELSEDIIYFNVLARRSAEVDTLGSSKSIDREPARL
jgi:cytochrome c oxidase assembly protein Cox11